MTRFGKLLRFLWTERHIDEVIGDERTVLPDDLHRPANWS